MKKISLLFCILSLFAKTNAQQAPRLLVRGDDMGYTHSGNLALVKCAQEGFQTSIEIIVPSPWFTEAVKLLGKIPDADVGIHLALTSEWENIKWRPLTDCASLKDKNGYFFPMVYPNKNYPGQAILENNWNLADIEKEFRAQIELALKYLPRISHLSSHMNCTNLSKEVAALTKKLAAEYHIPVDPEPAGLLYAPYAGPHNTLAEKIDSFGKMLDTLEPGKTYLFVDHPGFDNEELRAVFHIGYENVAADRQGVTDLFTNSRIKALIAGKGIQLISYKDLVPRK